MPNRDVNPEIVIEEYLVNELPGPSSDNKEDSTVTMAVREANPKPLPKSKKRVGDYKTSELSSIATEHEKCLRILADSNNNLANAIRKRRKIKSAVLNLQF
ncbi:unnamed protein product [Tenebrio molitor]|nr:unnamed protein product [Tenebrio molitor]